MKKKFLALLLTVMMVAVLVPAIVASALAPVAASVTAGAVGEGTDDRAEVATHDPLLEDDNIEVLNKDGVRVGYYKTLAEAVADLREGDTVVLLDNITVSAEVELSGKIVLDGNGYMITYAAEVEEPTDPEGGEPTDPEGGEPTDPEGGEPTDPEGGEPTDPEGGEPTDPEGGEPTDPEGGEGEEPAVFSNDSTAVELPFAALSVVGNGTDIVIKNLVINVPELSVGINYNVGYGNGAVAELTLQNCYVSALNVAVFARGTDAALTVKGANSSYFAEGAAIAISGGFADIYGGTFLSNGEVLAANGATVAVYDGLFIGGDIYANVISSLDDATVILAGGEYATAAQSLSALFYTDNGDIKVLDGKYYQSGADMPVFEGDGVQIYDGFFYGQSEVDLGNAVAGEAYTVKSYSYEDPTFPANTKLDVVKELGYYCMSEVTYDAEWLAANGYVGTAYDVTNGVYNDYPVSYYAFELERAYWYLGNGGALTLTQDVVYEAAEAIEFRQRPQTSVVTLTGKAIGDASFALTVNVADSYALVATGGTYNISNLRLINNLGSAVLLDQDNTDTVGCVLNLQSGAMVAGYDEHVILVGAYATLNMYDGSYVHAAAGLDGHYDGTGFGVITLIGGDLNVYGGALGYARAVGEDGRYFDQETTALMSTVAVGVDGATDRTSNINVYNGKFGKSATNLTYATAIFNLTEESERMDGTRLYVESGEFNSAMNSIIRCSGRNIEILIKGGTFNGATVLGSSIGHSDLICVNGLSADVHNRLTIEGGSFSGGRDQINIRGFAAVSVSNSYHTGGTSAVFSLLGDPTAAPVTVTDITVETTVTPFWCDGSALIVNGGEFTSLRTGWGHAGFAIVSNAATAGDITVNGGVYNVSNGFFVTNNGSAKRTVTLNGLTFNSVVAAGSGICMNDSGGADVIVNGGVYSNMVSPNHLIETYGDPAKTVGTLTINGDVQFVKGGSASGRMIKFYGSNNVTINGGYFDSKTSESIVIEKDSNRSYTSTLTLTINGGTFRNDVDGYSIIFMNGNAEADIVITDGIFQNYSNGWGPCLDVSGKGVTNVYGGSFESIAAGGSGSDACVTVGDGICNIYAGTFRANGMCVARGLAGKTGGETDLNGSITTKANSRLNIYGGVFTLENNPVRTAGNYSYDAVIRCGGGSTYAFVSIYGGTFINNSGCSERVISKNNVHSSINLTGGVFMASAVQKFYFKSSGMAPTGGSENPTTPLEKTYNDPIVKYGDKQYRQLVYGTGASTFNGKMEDGAQIRLVSDGENYKGGLRFVTRYSAASIASLKSFAGDDLKNVTFGTLLVESEKLEGLETVSHAGLKHAGIEYMDVVAEDGVSGSESAGFVVAAALSNIGEEDYATSYSAVGYALIMINDVTPVYFYTEYDAENNSRSLAQVAEAALADVSESQTKGYVYAHITMEGMYSRYTEEQQAVLQSYVSAAEAE
ncbi:MAG: hypothetical protein IKM08_06690 [Clostridia bacterium]|nr:hypothetical protein [Clostridia bacterium]